jgi:capsular exopolysaccharide synthesis family protein
LIAWGHFLRRHRGKLLLGAAVGLALAFVVTDLQPTIYRARAALEIQDSPENFMNLRDQDPTASAATRATSESYLLTQIKILQSRTLIERVVAKLPNYSAGPAPEAGPTAPWTHLRAFFSRSAPSAQRQLFVDSVANHVTVRAPAQTHIVEVFFDSEDPQLAADFTNALVQEFIAYSREMRWESAQKTVDWLTIQLGQMKTKLEASEARLQAYAESAGLSFTDEPQHLAELKLRQIQDELSRAQAERAVKQSRYELAASRTAEALPASLEDGALKEYRLKLTELERELADLSSTLTPEHYRVRRVQAQIAQLHTAIRQEQENILTRSANEYAAAKRREDLVAQAYAEQATVLSDQAEKAIQYNTLRHEVETNHQIYSALLQRIQQAGLASAMRAGNILIVDTAEPPLLPYRPNLFLNSAIGLLCGSFIAFGFAMLRERLDVSFRDPGMAPLHLSLPELGIIPRFGKGHDGQVVVSPAKDGASLMLFHPASACAQRDPLVADSFRATVTSILLPDADCKTARAIVVTSPDPGAGKTTVTSRMGIAAAEMGLRVVLVDGDLRRSSLNEVFQLASSPGLSDLLRSDVDLDTTPLLHLALQTQFQRLFMLPSGGFVTNATQLLYSQQMITLLRRLRGEFDLVLIDAPPLVHLADARVLGRLADGVILVLRAGRTTRMAAAQTCERLAEDGTRIIGTILNSWDFTRASDLGYGDLQDVYARGSGSAKDQSTAVVVDTTHS